MNKKPAATHKDTFQPVRLSASERAALTALAARNERSRSAELRMALRAWFDANGVIIPEA